MPAVEVPTTEGTAPEFASLERLRVIVADGDPLARRVMRDVFQNGAGFDVAAEAAAGGERVALALHSGREVPRRGAVLRRSEGIVSACRILERAPEVKVVIFSASR